MSFLESAFNLMLSIHAKEVTIKRIGTATISATVKIAPSNYFRNTEAPSDTVIPGREFVVSKRALDLSGFPQPKRGDKLIRDDMGTMTITEVREMFDVGSSIIGFRLRTA